MDAWTIGTNIGTMLTGVSAVTAAYVWTRAQWRERQDQRAAIRLRNWHGYIDVHSIDTWHVRLADDSDDSTATVVLEATDRDGRLNVSVAQRIRRRVREDGMLSRTPSSDELSFLIHLRQEAGYGRRDSPVR